jgi:hypothetical protein
MSASRALPRISQANCAYLATLSGHPVKFHTHLYAEADYFMTEDLKSTVKMNFCASTMTPMSHSEFENLVEELYSTNGN